MDSIKESLFDLKTICLFYGAYNLFNTARYIEPRHENLLFASAKIKAQLICTFIAQLISAFVFATSIVKSLNTL